MALNTKVATLLLGLVVGAVAGYLTRPQAAEIKLGNVSLEFSDNRVSTGSSDNGLTSGQTQHILLYALGGGVAGLLVGFALDRR